MKLIIKKGFDKNNNKPNIEKIELLSTEFETVTFQINDNDIPVITFTDTEQSYLINKLYDKLDRINSDSQFEISEEDLILLGSNGGSSEPVDSRPYKVYTALLTQTGTDAPVATVLENTLGDNVQWTREDVGAYHINLENESLFSFDKTFILTSLPLTAINTGIQYSILSPSTIVINTFLSNNTAGDALGEVDLGQTSIEIRVYN